MEQRARKATRGLGPNSPIPEKLYFKIGEVSALVGVRAHVLRYWEKEVPAIRPGKSVSSQRRYRRKDVQVFREIRRLLHEERYTLAGARKRIMAGSRDDVQGPGGGGPGIASPEGSTLPETAEPGFAASLDGGLLALDGIAGLETEELGSTQHGIAEHDVDLAGLASGRVASGGIASGHVAVGAGESRAQLRLGFQAQAPEERAKRLRDGLRELIYLAGEEP